MFLNLLRFDYLLIGNLIKVIEIIIFIYTTYIMPV